MNQAQISPSVLDNVIDAPPSKSYTHRAIFAGTIARGESIIRNCLICKDTIATVKACKSFGADIVPKEQTFSVYGRGELITPTDVIDVGNSGTTLRLATGLSCHVRDGYVVLTGDESIRARPMKPLLDALKSLGIECWSARNNGSAPVIVKGSTLKGGDISIDGRVSSQFISSLLFTASKSSNPIRIRVEEGAVSKPYIDSTIRVMKDFGLRIERDQYSSFEVYGLEYLRPSKFVVPGDFGLSAFLLAGAALTEGKVTVNGLDFSMPQADRAIVDVLEEMGVRVVVDESNGRVTAEGQGRPLAGNFQLGDSPDLLPVVALLASKAEGVTEIRGVAHARFKESDRIMILARELKKLGIKVKELDDGLIIEGNNEVRGGSLDPDGDHRLFMAFCVLGLVCEEGCRVEGVESMYVSYPNFLSDLEKLGGKVEEI